MSTLPAAHLPVTCRRHFLEYALAASSLTVLGPYLSMHGPRQPKGAFRPIQQAWAAPQSHDNAQTIDHLLGATRTALEELNAHEHDSFYLGTPYGNIDLYGGRGPLDTWDCWYPNGRPKETGEAYMNCAGFIVAVLESCGCNCDTIGSYVSPTTGYNNGNKANASRWYNFLIDHASMYARYESKEELLSSGQLRKGDIIYAEPRNWEDPDADCHIMFFWGDTPDHDLAWHSCEHGEGVIAGTCPGNMISRISAKYANCFWLHIPLSNTVELTVSKRSAQASLPANSENPAYALEGATFSVFRTNENGELRDQLTQFTTDKTGNAHIELPANTDAWIREDVPPRGFTAWSEPRMLTVGNTPAHVELEDDPCLVHVVLEKRDAETGCRPQGWATFEGALYELEDSNGALHMATTAWSNDHNGWIAQFPCIPCGQARIREAQPPRGYLATLFPYAKDGWKDIDLAPESNKATTTVTLDPHAETVVRGTLSGCKFAETPEDSDIKNPLAECEFALWLQDDGTLAHKGYAVEAIYAESSGPVLDAQGNPLRGTYMGSIRSHEDGRFTSDDLLQDWDPSKHNDMPQPQDALPYGSYTLIETRCPNPALKLIDPITDISLRENGQEVFLALEDKRIASPVRVIKIDAESGKPVLTGGTSIELLSQDEQGVWSSVVFDTHSPAHNDIIEFTLDETGMVQFPERLPLGHYAIRETRAIPPYTLYAELVEFDVEDDRDWNASNPLEITLPNKPSLGSIKGLKTDSRTGAGVAGARYAVYAAADITTPDGVTHAREGDLVEESETDESGCFSFDNLCLGSGTATYIVQETAAPSGYIADETNHCVTLHWQDSETTLVTHELDIKEAPTEMIVQKCDARTKEAIEGVEIAAYRVEESASEDPADEALAEESTDFETKSEHEKNASAVTGAAPDEHVHETEDLYGVETTNEQGEVYFRNLKNNNFYRFEETAVPTHLGYAGAICRETLFLDECGLWHTVKTSDEGVPSITEESMLRGQLAFENNPTEVLIYKVDERALESLRKHTGEAVDPENEARIKALAAKAFLEGGQFELVDEDGATIEALTSEGKGATWSACGAQPQTFTRLVPGHTYTVIEHAAPDGFERAAHHTEFTVEDTDKPQIVLVGNKKVERLPQTGHSAWWPTMGAAAAVTGIAAFSAYSKRRIAVEQCLRMEMPGTPTEEKP